ncbi:MAG: hypothetical protein HY328_01730 [Chloroflexi bacterium]|nr:hypothetical protein [Chloroflexota bacterium]
MPTFQLHLLGSFQCTGPDGADIKLRSDKARALLSYLVLEAPGKPVRRNHLAGLFWPGYLPKSATQNFRNTLSNLRKALAPLDILRADAKTVTFTADHPDFWCDALEAARLSGRRPGESHDPPLLQGFYLEDCPRFMAWLEDRRAALQAQPAAAHPHAPQQEPVGLLTPAVHWGDIPAPVELVGREPELAQLAEWGAQGAKVIGIFGMGGQGKTALAAEFVRGLAQAGPVSQTTTAPSADPFACIIWRSLVNAPPWQNILGDWVDRLSEHTITALPAHLDDQLALLIELLVRRRSLLVLDNLEGILDTGERAGRFWPGYEGYEQLIQRLAHSDHPSCLLITSRERPRVFERLTQLLPGVRALRLSGLSVAAGIAILHEQEVSASHTGLDVLAQLYSGNPLALLLAARTVHELFHGDVAAFLAQDALIFDDIRDVLDVQFGRMTVLEKDLMLWLSIEREPVSISVLAADLYQRHPRAKLVEALRSLQRRLLVEPYPRPDGTNALRFGLQNVVLEYTTNLLVEQMVEEIESERLTLFRSHALKKAQSQDFVRAAQERLLVAAVAERLRTRWREVGTEKRLRQLLAALQAADTGGSGYAAANCLHLALRLGLTEQPWDLSRLELRQADLRSSLLPSLDLTETHLISSPVLEPVGWPDRIAFSADGRLLAIASAQGEVRVWDAVDLQLVWSSPVQGNQRRFIAFSPDSRFLACARPDGLIHLWDTQQWQLRDLLHLGEEIAAIAFHPNSLLLAAGGAQLALWNLESGARKNVAIAPLESVMSIVFDAAGERMAVAGYGGSVLVYSTRSDAIELRLGEELPVITQLTFSSQGRFLVGGGRSEELFVWELPCGQRRSSPDFHEGLIYTLAFHPKEEVLAYAGLDKVIRLWDAQSERLLGALTGHEYVIFSLAFSSDGSVLASGSADRTVRLWDWPSGRSLFTLPCYENGLRHLAVSPDGALLAAAGTEGAVALWSLPAVAPPRILRQHTGAILTLAFSPDHRLLASAGVDSTICVWRSASATLAHSLHGHTKLIESLAFHPDGRYLVSGGYDKYLLLWDVEQGEIQATLPVETPIGQVAFHPLGSMLAACGDDRRIHLWQIGPQMEPSSPVEILIPNAAKGHWLSLAFHPMGKWLVCGSHTALHFIDLECGTISASVGHEGFWVSAIAFQPGGDLLAYRGPRAEIRLWDIAAHAPVGTLNGHSTLVYSVAFSPDGRYLYSCATDGDVRVWDVARRECVQVLRPPGPYAGMNIQGVTGISAAQRSSLLALGAVEG